MSFLLSCPNCGKRLVSEFSFGGEYSKRPKPGSDFSEWTDYVFMRKNSRGKQLEWWYHRNGCQRWFLVLRNTTNSSDHRSFWFEEKDDMESAEGDS